MVTLVHTSDPAEEGAARAEQGRRGEPHRHDANSPGGSVLRMGGMRRLCLALAGIAIVWTAIALGLT